MSEEDKNKKLIRQMYEGLNKRDITVWDKVCSLDYIYHQTSGDMTLEQSKQYSAVVLAAFPDYTGNIDDMIAEGDKVASRATTHGTHKGAFMGVAPTDKLITITEFKMNRFAGGKLVETWALSDQLSFIQQLGVIPQMGQK